MKVREVKQYDERLQEILNAAQELFAAFGYSKVSIQKIIDRVGIAKGTFYHYFSSKEELLDALVMKFAEGLLEELSVIVEDESKPAKDKLNALMIQGTKAKLEGNYSEIVKVMMTIMMNPDNSLLMDRISQKVAVMAIPLYSSIIKAGCEDGSWDIEFHDEAAEMLISLSKSLQGKFQAVFAIEDGDELKAEYRRLMHIFETSIERLLGAEKGCLAFVTPEILNLVENFCAQYKH